MNSKSTSHSKQMHVTSAPNILPYDGEVRYLGKVMDVSQSRYFLYRLLHTLAWRHDEARMFGRHIVTRRKVAWYGDQPYSYTYSNTTKCALPWTPDLLKLKKMVETCAGTQFNSCLLNLYHDGEEGMAWHSDDERELGKNTTIASLSLGARRRFTFKHRRTSLASACELENGSLLLMQGSTQSHWLHSLPKSRRIKTARVNLTFRTIIK